MGRAGARSGRAGAQACQTETLPTLCEQEIGEGCHSSATGVRGWLPLALPADASKNGKQHGRGAGGSEGRCRAEHSDQWSPNQRA